MVGLLFFAIYITHIRYFPASNNKAKKYKQLS